MGGAGMGGGKRNYFAGLGAERKDEQGEIPEAMSWKLVHGAHVGSAFTFACVFGGIVIYI